MILWIPMALAADPTLGVCAGQRPCQLVSADPAGVDAQGATLEVVRVALGTGSIEDMLSPQQPCVPQQVWLVRTTAGHKRESERLFELCNDGYGAAGIGEDSVAVGPNSLVHSQSGGSAWRWTTTRELKLSPLRLLAEADDGMWTLGPNEGGSRWDWSKFAGTASFTVPLSCETEGGDTISGEYALIPRVAVSNPLAWREAAIGRCGLRVDASGDGGYVAYGEPGTPSDAAMSVLFGEPTSLWIQLDDDVWVESADSPIHADHVEIWVGPSRNAWFESCLPSGEGAEQWLIPLAGGEAIPGYGDPKRPPSIERSGHRLRVQLAEPPGSVTVVYSDSDDGLSQERLLSTSALRFGDARSLGGVFDVRPERASCAVVDGQLQPVVRPGLPR